MVAFGQIEQPRHFTALARPLLLQKDAKIALGQDLEVAEPVKGYHAATSKVMSYECDVMELDVLGRRGSTRLKRGRLVAIGWRLGEQPRLAALAKLRQELPNPCFGQKKIRGKRICPNLADIGAIAGAAYGTVCAAVNQNVSVFVREGKSAAQDMLTAIDNRKGPDPEVRKRQT